MLCFIGCLLVTQASIILFRLLECNMNDWRYWAIPLLYITGFVLVFGTVNDKKNVTESTEKENEDE